jgi:hypothetical protein
VFATWSKPEGPDPLSILAHQLRRRFPSCSSLVRGARLTYLTTWPEGSLVFQPDRPAQNSNPKIELLRENRPMFRGPSWETLYRVPLRSPSPRGGREPRRATGRFLFRRLLPAGSNQNPKALLIACRRRSDLWSPAASARRCRLLERPGPPSRSLGHHAHLNRVAEAKYLVTSLWITGISGTTIGTFLGRAARLPFRSLCLTSPKCLNLLRSIPNRLICRV